MTHYLWHSPNTSTVRIFDAIDDADAVSQAGAFGLPVAHDWTEHHNVIGKASPLVFRLEPAPTHDRPRLHRPVPVTPSAKRRAAPAHVDVPRSSP